MRRVLKSLAVAGALALPFAAGAQAPPPAQVPYVGFLADAAGTAVDGTVSITVRIYDSENAVTAAWQEVLPSVTVTAGYFSIDLGRVAPLGADVTAGRTRYLGIQVGNDPEMLPRQAIGSVPYALVAGDTLRLGGRPAADFLDRGGVQAVVDAGGGLDEAALAAWLVDNGYVTAEQVNALIDARGYLNRDAILALIQGLGYLNGPAVDALIDARSYLNASAVDALIDARSYLDSEAVTVLISEQGGLTEEEINALIDARNYLSEADITTLVSNLGALDAAAVNALIDARSYLDAAGVNALIAAQGYLTQAQIAALIAGAGHLDAAGVRAILVADGYVTSAALAQALGAAQAQLTLVSNRVTALEQTVTAQGATIATQGATITTQGATITSQGVAITALQAALTALTTRVDGLAGADTLPFLLGRSAQSSNGRFTFGGANGIEAANNMCKVSFPNEPRAHLCTSSDLQVAMGLNRYTANANFDTVRTWTVTDNARGSTYVNSYRNTCQSLMYNSGDAGRGTSVLLRLNAQSDGNGGGVSGNHIEYSLDIACGSNLPVLCCR